VSKTPNVTISGLAREGMERIIRERIKKLLPGKIRLFNAMRIRSIMLKKGRPRNLVHPYNEGCVCASCTRTWNAAFKNSLDVAVPNMKYKGVHW
jgi:hypothetical protein